MARGWLVVWFVASLTLAACAGGKTPDELRALARQSVAFLEDGGTTREEALTTLGVPTAVFEDERILTYRMYLHDKAGLVVVRHGPPGPRYWRAVGDYHLILVFDTKSVLARHKLLKPGRYREPSGAN
jgi:hypothetical protein